MKRYTKEEVHAAVQANWADHMRTLAAHAEGAYLDRVTSGRYGHVWACGEWLAVEMVRQGATQTDAEAACFVVGQRSLFADPYAATADVLARWIDGNPQKPGIELADSINAEHMTPIEGGVLITREPVFAPDDGPDPVVTVRDPKGDA